MSESMSESIDGEIPSYDAQEFANQTTAELKVVAEQLMDEGMKYDHIGHEMHQYGLQLMLISQRGQAIAECENVVGEEIDVPLLPESVETVTPDTDTDSE